MLLRRDPPALRAREQALQEEIARYDATLGLYQERLADLELAAEDVGWAQIGGQGDYEFDRATLDKIIRRARLMWLSHPLIRRSVVVQTYYVFGQGVTIAARDDQANEVLQGFWMDRRNRAAVTGHQARAQLENTLQVDGNVVLALPTDPSTGRVHVRTVVIDEIRDVICNPDDRMEPWFYRREWDQRAVDPRAGIHTTQRRVALYPDWAYRPDGGVPDTYAGLPVRVDTPLMHTKVGGLGTMRFGLPDFYAAMDWARGYKEFLEDVASVWRSLSRFAWQLKSKKPKAAKAKLGTSRTASTGESNPAPIAGSVFIPGDDDTTLTPIPKTGATLAANDGRQLRLMVAAATDIPDTMLANDPNMGNLATARTLDRPTELAMRDRQTLWADVYRDLAEYVLGQAMSRPNGPLRNSDVETAVDVHFPSIREPNAAEIVGAIVNAATLGGKPQAGLIPEDEIARQLLHALGSEHVEKILAARSAPPEETA